MYTFSKSEENYHRIVDFIDDFRSNYGVIPSVREIAAGVGIPRSTISRHLMDMREKGLIDYDGRRNITTPKILKLREETVRVPVLGQIACGIPQFAEENIEEYVYLPVSLFGRGNYFLLHAYGKSMVEADIFPGDLVLIRQQSTAEVGQIVVALVNDSATLKRYYPEPEHRRIRLHPENREMEDIIVEDCAIQGIAVNVIKAVR